MPLPPFFRTGLADILPSEPACVKIEFMNPDTEIEVPPAWTAFLETEPLQNAAGFSLGLAIALELKNDTLELLTPVKDAAAAAGVRFGSLKVEPGTWREQAAGP